MAYVIHRGSLLRFHRCCFLRSNCVTKLFCWCNGSANSLLLILPLHSPAAHAGQDDTPSGVVGCQLGVEGSGWLTKDMNHAIETFVRNTLAVYSFPSFSDSIVFRFIFCFIRLNNSFAFKNAFVHFFPKNFTAINKKLFA